jgi:hypothetical protein
MRAVCARSGTMKQNEMYEVWWSRGSGTYKGPRFRRLEDALRYVDEHAAEASFAVRGPVGYWHRQGGSGRITFDRRR